MKRRILALALLLLGVLAGYFIYSSETPDAFFKRPFKLGLDLLGGSHLVYEADTSLLASEDVNAAMTSLREIIEKRVNVFGVSEPVVQTEQVGLGPEARHRLIVELPGVTDLEEAKAMIKAMPLLEFMLVQGGETEDEEAQFVPTGLTGRFLKRAQVEFNSRAINPSIGLEFNDEGGDLFAEITKNHVEEVLAIFLDGQLLSAPVIREEIRGGRAEISGDFTREEAKILVRNLNLGALPVPVQLISTQTIGPKLGEEMFTRGVLAGIWGLILVVVFMVVWYRLPGFLAVISLAIYIALVLSVFKLLPVTLTAAGIAGFILSIGLAVDANVLIFERVREELYRGDHITEALKEGFRRAWPSIRDANLTSIISAVVLFWFGSSLIKGFALTLIIGILISLFTAIVVTRTFLLALGMTRKTRLSRFLFGSGF